MGSIGQTSTFSEHGHVAYHFKSDHELQQPGSEYFARRHPPSTLGIGSVGQRSTLSEHVHVAYQIKEKHKCSNMAKNVCLQTHYPPSHDPGDGVNGSIFFSDNGHVAYQFKGNYGMQQHSSK